jgi:hypothetical protein
MYSVLALLDAELQTTELSAQSPFHVAKFLGDTFLHTPHPAFDERDSSEHYTVEILVRPCFCNQDLISVSLPEP